MLKKDAAQNCKLCFHLWWQTVSIFMVYSPYPTRLILLLFSMVSIKLSWLLLRKKVTWSYFLLLMLIFFFFFSNAHCVLWFMVADHFHFHGIFFLPCPPEFDQVEMYAFFSVGCFSLCWLSFLPYLFIYFILFLFHFFIFFCYRSKKQREKESRIKKIRNEHIKSKSSMMLQLEKVMFQECQLATKKNKKNSRLKAVPYVTWSCPRSKLWLCHIM